MGLIEQYDLGTFITVLYEKPQKFHVFANHLDANTADPLNQIPYYLLFSQLPPLKENPIKFVIRISSNLEDFYFKSRIKDMFFMGIKCGLMKYKGNAEAKEFDFFTTDYENMIATTLPRGNMVRNEILKFMNYVNAENPSWRISLLDLEVNINADKDQIGQWAEDLVRSGFILSESVDIKNKIYGGSINMPHFFINSKMRNQIEVDIDIAEKSNIYKKKAVGSLEIFISYSHKDKKLAAEISTKLKEFGFETFLAHEYIEVDKDWRLEILKHLHSCDVFVALITDDFNKSDWTHQEAGYAMAKEKKIISVKLGGRLEGFLEARQALPANRDGANKIAEEIRKILGKYSK